MVLKKCLGNGSFGKCGKGLVDWDKFIILNGLNINLSVLLDNN